VTVPTVTLPAIDVSDLAKFAAAVFAAFQTRK
jgi:hypothetical protein